MTSYSIAKYPLGRDLYKGLTTYKRGCNFGSSWTPTKKIPDITEGIIY